ncbi:MAG: ligand-gated channel protein, partial [Pseudoalteromonas tetraodonis]
MKITPLLINVTHKGVKSNLKIKKMIKTYRGFLFANCLYKLRSNHTCHLAQFGLVAPLFLSISVYASQTEGQMMQFDIKAQRADKALIEFAKQTEQTVVFSYELAKQYEANSLYGFYSQLDA